MDIGHVSYNTKIETSMSLPQIRVDKTLLISNYYLPNSLMYLHQLPEVLINQMQELPRYIYIFKGHV
jgi:hypothetical protein